MAAAGACKYYRKCDYFFPVINGYRVNIEPIRSEADLVYVFRKTLDKSAFSIVEREPSRPTGQPDLILKAQHGGVSRTFAAEFKLRLTVADLDKCAVRPKGKNHPLLVTVLLSESLVAHCRNRRLNCLDLNGTGLD